jgi:hypothetical protein
MLRSIAVRAVGAIAAVAAISCCSAVSRAETLSPLGAASAPSQGLLGSFGSLPADSATEVSAAVLRSVVSESESVAYHAAVASPSFGSQVVRTAPGMGFGFEKVPFAQPNFIRASIDVSDIDGTRPQVTSLSDFL